MRLSPEDEVAQKVLGNNRTAIEVLGRVGELIIGDGGSLAKCAVATIIVSDSKVKVVVPLEGLVDIE